MRSFRRFAFLLLLGVAWSHPAFGQSLAATDPRLPQRWQPDVTLPSILPANPAAPVLGTRSPATAVPPAALGRGGKKEAVALMIVGGAGILTGLLVDEDIITIAGAGVAGVGLYPYLR
jgi:hypothetical protein